MCFSPQLPYASGTLDSSSAVSASHSGSETEFAVAIPVNDVDVPGPLLEGGLVLLGRTVGLPGD